MLFGLLCWLSASAQETGTPPKETIAKKDISISFDYVKHLVFPAQVSDIAIGKENLILAERVEEAPHIVRLSAQAEDFEEETNLTVVCALTEASIPTTSLTSPAMGQTCIRSFMKTTANGSTTITGRK